MVATTARGRGNGSPTGWRRSPPGRRNAAVGSARTEPAVSEQEGLAERCEHLAQASEAALPTQPIGCTRVLGGRRGGFDAPHLRNPTERVVGFWFTSCSTVRGCNAGAGNAVRRAAPTVGSCTCAHWRTALELVRETEGRVLKPPIIQERARLAALSACVVPKRSELLPSAMTLG
jgi:hypothetical protein